MKILSLLLAMAAAAIAQDDTVVNLKATGPLGSTATAKISWKQSQVTYNLGSCTTDVSGVCALPISITNRTGYLPAALQFELRYGVDVASVGFVVGPAAASAGKTIACAPVTSGTRCVISGMNQLTIADGVVALATIQTVITAPDPTTAILFGTVTASATGKQITSIIASGGGVITMPALLATVSCAQPDIWTDGVVTCTVALNKPSPTAVNVPLSSDSGLVGAPASVTIPAGATSATFTVTGT